MKMPLLRYLLLLVSACVPCCDKAHAEAAPQEAEAPQHAASFSQEEETTDIYVSRRYNKTSLFLIFGSISILLLLIGQWCFTGEWHVLLTTFGLTAWVIDLCNKLVCLCALVSGSPRMGIEERKYFRIRRSAA